MNLDRFRAGCAEQKPFGINWRSSNLLHDAIHVLYGLYENYIPAVAIQLRELLDRDVHWRRLAQNGRNSI